MSSLSSALPMSASLDPHLSSPAVAPFLTTPGSPEDATRAPEPSDQRHSEDDETRSLGINLLLPRVYLIRHGQSLFNAMHAAWNKLPPADQSSLNHLTKSSSASSSSPPAHDPSISEGVLIGGLPLHRARNPNTDPRLLDAPLTPLGQEQAREASKKAATLDIDLVLSTPLTRAIQTSLLVFRPNSNKIDWEHASTPSLNQPMHNILVADGDSHSSTPNNSRTRQPLIRIVPYHVEALYASCDIGVPLSILSSRFSSEPNMDFETARRLMSDCWWYGAERGANITHLVIKRTPMNSRTSSPVRPSTTKSPSSVSSSSSSSSSSPSSTPSSSITLKSTDKVASLKASSEPSHHIESRLKQLIRYILELALEHGSSINPHHHVHHRPLNLALVGHCGFFARLSGHTLANCEILELDWSHVLNRGELKGFLSLPKGFNRTDITDVTKQGAIIRHWLDDIQYGTNRSSEETSKNHFSPTQTQISSNTADLVPLTKLSSTKSSNKPQ